MAINEIEVSSSSVSFKCWTAEVDDLGELISKIKLEGDQFNIEDELPGFHDYDMGDGLIRGYYSGIVPFEIEHLVDKVSTKTLFRRIETCEFFLTPSSLFITGKPGPMKGLSHALSALTGHSVELIEFEFDDMNLLQERMTEVKTIVLTNPKDKEIRRVRLAGRIESYTEYNVIDPRNHGIDSVSGVIDTPIGPLTATISKKGGLRLNVKKGLIILVEHLDWIMSLIRDEKRPDPVNAPQSVF